MVQEPENLVQTMKELFYKIGPWIGWLAASIAAKFSIDYLQCRKFTWATVITSTILCVVTGVSAGLLWQSWQGAGYSMFVTSIATILGEKFWLWIFGNWDKIMKGIFGKIMKKQ